MSDQGDTGQWRPASHTGPYSEPDEPTGPLPAVSGGEAVPPAFPPVSAPPDDRRAADEASAGFPGTSATRGSPSPVKRERAPFEPADPPAVPADPPARRPAPAGGEPPESGAGPSGSTSGRTAESSFPPPTSHDHEPGATPSFGSSAFSAAGASYGSAGDDAPYGSEPGAGGHYEFRTSPDTAAPSSDSASDPDATTGFPRTAAEPEDASAWPSPSGAWTETPPSASGEHDDASPSASGAWGTASGSDAWSASSASDDMSPAGADDRGDAPASGPGAGSDTSAFGSDAWHETAAFAAGGWGGTSSPGLDGPDETPASAPGAWSETSSATPDRSETPASAPDAWAETSSSDTWGGTSSTPETPASSSGRHRAGPPDSTPPFGAEIPPVDPYDARDGRHGYEVADPAFGLGGSAAGSSIGSSATGRAAPEDGAAPGREVPDVSSMWETPAYEAGDRSARAGESSGAGTSFDDAPPPRPFGAPGEPFPGAPDGGHRAPAGDHDADHDADHEFFGSADDPAHWGKVVAPSGPPPQPGKPSSGNLRLPDWMREESRGASAAGGGSVGYDDYGYEDDEGRSKLPLIAGLGVLVAGLVVAGGVYLLKSGGNGEPQSAAHTTSSGPTRSAAPKSGGSAAQRPQKALPMFNGRHTAAVGRIVDQRAGLSYPRLGRPWQMQPKNGQMTELGFSAGQYAVTERAHGEPTRWARLMSGRLGGADKGAYQGAGTEQAAATRVAETYEARMYAFKHRKKLLASQPLDVGGHKGWLVGYYLTYHRPASRATGDIFTVAVVDTGRKEPGVLLMSVPNTSRRLYPDVDYVVHSLKVS